VLIFPTIRINDKHKFIPQLKKFLNELVQPSPNLALDDVVDDATLKAVYQFKTQWFRRILTSEYDKSNLREITPGLWAMIGRALGKDKLLPELRATKDNELRSLLLGLDVVSMLSTYYTSEMEGCDAKIASVFGDKNAVAAANEFDPDGLALVQLYKFGDRYRYYRGDEKDADGSVLPGHLSTSAMHLYGSKDGTRFGVNGNSFVNLYVPDGFKSPEKIRKSPSPKSASVDFYYEVLGNVKDVTLLVSHIKDFKLKKENNRWHIGKIGGKGGDSVDYIHSHIDLFKGNVGMTGKRDRISFATAFC
jgi:hypothetical protein